MTPDWIGWLATVIFLASYSCKDQGKLRRVQAAAAVVWVIYGVILNAVPIVVANLLVAFVAVYSSLAGNRTRKLPSAVAESPLSPSSGPDLSRIS